MKVVMAVGMHLAVDVLMAWVVVVVAVAMHLGGGSDAGNDGQ